jgi:hypothetical protein
MGEMGETRLESTNDKWQSVGFKQTAWRPVNLLSNSITSLHKTRLEPFFAGCMNMSHHSSSQMHAGVVPQNRHRCEDCIVINCTRLMRKDSRMERMCSLVMCAASIGLPRILQQLSAWLRAQWRRLGNICAERSSSGC